MKKRLLALLLAAVLLLSLAACESSGGGKRDKDREDKEEQTEKEPEKGQDKEPDKEVGPAIPGDIGGGGSAIGPTPKPPAQTRSYFVVNVAGTDVDLLRSTPEVAADLDGLGLWMIDYQMLFPYGTDGVRDPNRKFRVMDKHDHDVMYLAFDRAYPVVPWMWKNEYVFTTNFDPSPRFLTTEGIDETFESPAIRDALNAAGATALADPSTGEEVAWYIFFTDGEKVDLSAYASCLGQYLTIPEGVVSMNKEALSEDYPYRDYDIAGAQVASTVRLLVNNTAMSSIGTAQKDPFYEQRYQLWFAAMEAASRLEKGELDSLGFLYAAPRYTKDSTIVDLYYTVITRVTER